MLHRGRFCTSVSLALFAALSILAIAGVDAAQAQERESFQYAVKFVCGKSDGVVVAPGAYFTAINVHNPGEKAVSFRKKFAIALPGEKPGPISKFFDARLRPDEAFEIDCPDIFKLSGSTTSFIKGFAVIETPRELDIVAVYTAAGRSGSVETMDVETAKPRRLGIPPPPGLPDLLPVPNPSTGDFCDRDPRSGNLIVRVRNQGTADAGPSTTKVDFGSSSVDLPTPMIPAGGVVLLSAPVPGGCFNPDCEFRITADSTGVVAESNEGNNTASGTCIG